MRKICGDFLKDLRICQLEVFEFKLQNNKFALFIKELKTVMKRNGLPAKVKNESVVIGKASSQTLQRVKSLKTIISRVLVSILLYAYVHLSSYNITGK